MATTRTESNLDEVLGAELDRDNFGRLVECLYESYASVDTTDTRIRELESKLEGLSDEEERDLTEKLGVLHVARGNYGRAAELLGAVRTRKNAAHFLGRAYLKLGRAEEALDELAAGRAGDDDLESDVLMVEAHCELRQPDQAEKALKGHKGDEPELTYARAHIAETRGEYGEAMELYESVIEEHPGHAPSLFRLALNCDLNGDDDRAMELYRRCTNLRPTYVGALMNLGVLYEDHGMYYEAIDCYKRVLAIDPRHRRARLYLKGAESSLSMFVDMAKTRRMRRLEEVFSLPVSSFELSSRSRNALDRRDVTTLGGLAQLTREELLKERNFGDTSLEEIEQLLARYDLELGEQGGEAVPGAGVIDNEMLEKLSMPIEALDFSGRCRKCMDSLGITTVGGLVQRTEGELLAVPNFGETSLEEIKQKLDELGLSLKG